MINITVVGTGYVGLVTGTCFAEVGNRVTCVDIDQKKIENLKNGILPIYEPGLDEMVKENFAKGNLIFTSDLKNTISGSDMCFIAVGTPMGEDGSADLKYVKAVAKEIGSLIEKHTVVVNKSTVPVGTGEIIRKVIQDELDKRQSKVTFDIVSNPEFLREGSALNDFMKPDRIIVGTDNEKALDAMKRLYDPFCSHDRRMIAMDIKSSEMTKYASNSLLATKISFINEIANICELVGANVNLVREGVGSDHRIGYSFINPGCGYGGSCFPKDVQALIRTAKEYDYEPRILNAVEAVNFEQKSVLIKKFKKHFNQDLAGKTVAIWGLAFKPGTDDMREASSIVMIQELEKAGVKIHAYDPKAEEQAKNHYLKDIESITYFNSKYSALNDADALFLVTEWKEFCEPDFMEIKKRLKTPLIFDGRNQYSNFNLQELGFTYYSVGCREKTSGR